MSTPKIFISYSWQPITNKNWTLDFADRLTRDGIHVIIDEWDATEGMDKYKFMEKMINDPEIERVLMICNKEYAEKANLRKGGVGIESMIVSDEIYSKVDQKKFIPIVRERIDGKECLPVFLNSRFYIDLSDKLSFEENYEQLIRNIFDKPKSRRPPIGEPPKYLDETEPTFAYTANLVRPLKSAISNFEPSVNPLLRDFLMLY